MPVAIEVLVPAKTVEAAQTTQYTSEGVAIIDKFTATNYSGAAATISVSLVTGGAAADNDSLIVQARSLEPGQTYAFPELVGHALAAGGFISTLAGTADSINMRVTGRLIT